MGGGMAGTCLHLSGGRKLSDGIDDTETIGLAVQADGGHAGPSASTTDSAAQYSGAGAGVLTSADPRTYIPITEATSVAAKTVDAAGGYSGAGASAPTTDPAGAYSGSGARAPPLASAGTYIRVTGATSSVSEIVHFGSGFNRVRSRRVG